MCVCVFFLLRSKPQNLCLALSGSVRSFRKKKGEDAEAGEKGGQDKRKNNFKKKKKKEENE